MRERSTRLLKSIASRQWPLCGTQQASCDALSAQALLHTAPSLIHHPDAPSSPAPQPSRQMSWTSNQTLLSDASLRNGLHHPPECSSREWSSSAHALLPRTAACIIPEYPTRSSAGSCSSSSSRSNSGAGADVHRRSFASEHNKPLLSHFDDMQLIQPEEGLTRIEGCDCCIHSLHWLAGTSHPTNIVHLGGFRSCAIAWARCRVLASI